MNNRGILDTVMSWLLFAFYVLTILMVMSICGCATTCKKSVESGITTDTGGIAELRASEELSAYLRTEMPDLETLKFNIDLLSGKGMLASRIDLDGAKDFLEENPEAYRSKDYAGFLMALYAYEKGGKVDANNVFDVVTKAMFSRQLFSKRAREMNENRLDDIYYTPTISVMFGLQPGFYYGSENWLSADPLALSAPVAGNAFKNLPTADGLGLTVGLKLNRDEEARPLP